MTANQLQYWANQETKRANLAKEAENIRSNTAKEAENVRSNKAKEKETKRHNKWSEAFQGVDTATNLLESPTRGFRNLAGGLQDLF